MRRVRVCLAVADSQRLVIASPEPLRSGATKRIARMICTLCRVKVQPVAVSGTQTTVGCPKCQLRWRIDGEGQVMRG